jgi:alkylation response protein AidB-like acyl-CoA dehydrogenase
VSADLDGYREKLRSWLGEHIPAWWRDQVAVGSSGFEVVDTRFAELRVWHRDLFDAGYMGITWPVEYGGQGLDLSHQLAVAEELARADAPPTVNGLGIGLAGAALLTYGTEEQKQRYLKNMLSAEQVWCQGYSEPGSGSDLASLQTRAELEGDEYRVNGQKIWTSNGKHADWMFCLVRSAPDAPKHGGIGFLLIDMRSPGIEVSPLHQITDGSDFCQVFFTDVRVPAANMVGEPTQGWQIANHVLAHERGASVDVIRYERQLDALAQSARVRRHKGGALADDPVFRQRFAQLRIEYEVLRQSTYRTMSALEAGQELGPESSLHKLTASEFEQRLTAFGTSIQGPYAQLWQDEPRAVDEGVWQFRELWSRAFSIYSGSNEIQRNIISERVLGLPRR